MSGKRNIDNDIYPCRQTGLIFETDFLDTLKFINMKKLLPFLFATAISIIAISSSFTLADPELGISTAFLSWMACIWIVSGDKRNNGCLS